MPAYTVIAERSVMEELTAMVACEARNTTRQIRAALDLHPDQATCSKLAEMGERADIALTAVELAIGASSVATGFDLRQQVARARAMAH